MLLIKLIQSCGTKPCFKISICGCTAGLSIHDVSYVCIEESAIFAS